MRRIVTFVTIAAALSVTGCATVPGADAPAAAAVPTSGTAVPTAAAPPSVPPRPPEPTEGRRQLDRGVALFEQGRFAESLRQLQESPEIVADGPEVRAQALKYVAFAQCVTARRAACRRTFDALLVLDPRFALLPTEAGHPGWGAEFERAQAARAGANARR
jgi:hypothetical protein